MRWTPGVNKTRLLLLLLLPRLMLKISLSVEQSRGMQVLQKMR